MITNAKFINTDKYEIEITIRMSVGDWERLRSQLETRWPSGKLSEHISEATIKLRTEVRLNDKLEADI